MRIAIQGELGSNSHMAVSRMFAEMKTPPEIVPCATSPEVFDRVVSRDVSGAVLPIENSLHGSVAEHYDLLLTRPVKIVGEMSLRIRHNVIACAGVRLVEVRTVVSHPVALAQCRRWLAAHPEIRAVPFYDTAGGVKHIVETNAPDTAAVAPALAAAVYGAELLEEGIEDHAENYTRFLHLVPEQEASTGQRADKMSVAFSIEHRPGTLVRALGALAEAGADLTKIESRPVPGRPWEYVFYVDLRFAEERTPERALTALQPHCGMVKELGRYAAAGD